jgi:hypothetical protein
VDRSTVDRSAVDRSFDRCIPTSTVFPSGQNATLKIVVLGFRLFPFSAQYEGCDHDDQQDCRDNFDG